MVPRVEVPVLVQIAIDEIVAGQLWILLCEHDPKDSTYVAHTADLADAAGGRGRGGLTTPSVTQMVEEAHGMSSRSIRRHVSQAVKAIRGSAG